MQRDILRRGFFSYPKLHRCSAGPFSDEDKRQMASLDDAELFHSYTLKFLHEKFVLAREVARVRGVLG